MNPVLAILIALIGLLVLPIRAIVWLIKNHKHKLRMEELRAESKKQEEERRIKEKIKEERNKKINEEKERIFLEAAGRGVDVCWNCKTIEPRRCTCGICLEWKCNKSYYGKCRKCRELICHSAEICGEDFCWRCLTIEPGRCSCGNCLVCYNGSGNDCSVCLD
jgi:hypothetical protein